MKGLAKVKKKKVFSQTICCIILDNLIQSSEIGLPISSLVVDFVLVFRVIVMIFVSGSCLRSWF